MVPDGFRSQKERLLIALKTAETGSERLRTKAQSLVETTSVSGSIARNLHTIIEAAPNDSALSVGTWERLSEGWEAYGREVDRLSISMVSASTATATAQAASLTTTATEAAYSDWIGPSEKEAFKELQAALHRPSLVEETLASVKRLGLDHPVPERRSISQLIKESHLALTRPTGTAPSPSSVLIPTREAIQAILARLLTRRPAQEPAKQGRLKVLSIGRQCGESRLTESHFERLGVELDGLVDRLSQSKQASMELPDLESLFDQALQFIIAFLESLDKSLLR